MVERRALGEDTLARGGSALMFTGIVTAVGDGPRRRRRDGGLELVIDAPYEG